MKVIRDGKVAVLVSEGGYGAGWSTWNSQYPEMVFDPIVVDAVEKKLPLVSIERHLRDTYPNLYLSYSEYAQLKVYWLDEGTQFVIDVCDGLETIRLPCETDWIIA